MTVARVIARADDEGRFRNQKEPARMNASVTALIFVGLLLTVLGRLVAGSLALIGLGVASLFAAGLFETIAARGR